MRDSTATHSSNFVLKDLGLLMRSLRSCGAHTVELAGDGRPRSADGHPSDSKSPPRGSDEPLARLTDDTVDPLDQLLEVGVWIRKKLELPAVVGDAASG
jgi:hypothetical protein